MKKLVSTLALAAAMLTSVCFTTKAEKIDNLIKEGVVYYGNVHNYHESQDNFFRMVKWFSGSVDINGKTYYKLWSKDYVFSDQEKQYEIPWDGELIALLRYEDGKIYSYTLGREDVSDEILIYDASLAVGECCEVYSDYKLNYSYHREKTKITHSADPLKCFATATVTSCGNDFDLVYVNIDSSVDQFTDEDIKNELDGNGFPYWIKGAGSELVFEGTENNFFGLIGGYWHGLESIFCNGVKVFDSNDITNMRNIKTSGVMEVETDAEEMNAPKYHPDGTRFADGEKGIYIQNGKKHVAM